MFFLALGHWEKFLFELGTETHHFYNEIAAPVNVTSTTVASFGKYQRGQNYSKGMDAEILNQQRRYIELNSTTRKSHAGTRILK